MDCAATEADGDRGEERDADVARALADERAAVDARIAVMERELGSLFAASVDSNADDEHDPEGQTIAYERSQLSALIHAAHQQRAEIEAAQARLEDGVYGICQVCGVPIPQERLEVRPTARACVLHADVGRA